MDHPFFIHVLCLCMKYIHEKGVVYYSSVYGRSFYTYHNVDNLKNTE